MAWKIEFARSAAKELDKLDKPIVQKVLKFLKERVEQNPRAVGEQLKGELSQFWRYRVGDYRLYADIDDKHLTILIVKVGHRKNVYK